MDTKQTNSGYLLANSVSRDEADHLRGNNPGAVTSRNADGTYRVTRGR